VASSVSGSGLGTFWLSGKRRYSLRTQLGTMLRKEFHSTEFLMLRPVDISEDAYGKDFSRARGVKAMKFMSKMGKIFSICCIVVFSCLGFSPASSGKEGIGLKLTGEAMSAELQGVSLRLILERLEEEKGIWFKGDESALDESISIRFEDLPLHEGLRRILSNINHVLVFDRERGLVGLFILGKKDPGRGAPRGGGIATGKSLPAQFTEGATVSRDPFGDGPFTDMTSGPESPFSENPGPSSENPFAPTATSSSEGPFDKGIFPSSKDPFADSFDAFPESQGGRRWKR
jgi:hypothetical protein